MNDRDPAGTVEETREPAGSGELRGSEVIQVEKVSKVFQTRKQGKVLALDDVTFDVPYGEFVTVVGPSGCGKSTLIKLIAGLTPFSSGRIFYQGTEVRDRKSVV